jgi:hypothetical protein
MKTKVDTLSMTLTKTRNYNLIPFGKFSIKEQIGAKRKADPKILDFRTLRFNTETGMPYSDDQCKEIQKYMIKNKTDILTDEYGRDFYTLVGSVFTEVNHSKLDEYKEFLREMNLKINEESWNEYYRRMTE